MLSDTSDNADVFGHYKQIEGEYPPSRRRVVDEIGFVRREARRGFPTPPTRSTEGLPSQNWVRSRQNRFQNGSVRHIYGLDLVVRSSPGSPGATPSPKLGSFAQCVLIENGFVRRKRASVQNGFDRRNRDLYRRGIFREGEAPAEPCTQRGSAGASPSRIGFVRRKLP